MAGAPDFKIDIALPRGPSVGVSPAAPPSLDGLNVVSTAGEKFGAALSDLGAKIKHAQDQTTVNIKTTDYLTELDALREKHTQDPDFQNAPANFTRDQRELETRLSAEIPNDALRQKAVLSWRRDGLTAGKDVQRTAWTREVDANNAADGVQAAADLRDADNAASPIEKAAAVERRMRAIKDGVDAGWFSAVDGEKRARTFMGALDDVAVRRLGANDPAAAVKTLNNPEQFKWLAPDRRQTLIEHFQSQASSLQTAEQVNFAKVNPPGAIVNVGIVTPQNYGVLYNSVLQIESGGKAGAVSDKGALGLAQLMPDTARDMAKRLGMPDVAALDDAALKDRLLTDTKLNGDLGRAYWDYLGGRYQGSVPAMLAGYNAGPKRADEWARKATDIYGPNYTLGQFASVVDIKETKDYIAKFAKTAGVALDGPSFDRAGQLHASAAVGQVLSAQEGERAQWSKALAGQGRANNFADMWKAGQTPDPVAYATAMQANIDAAGRYGDGSAAKWVAETQFQERNAPVRDTAYRMSPAQLGATIDKIEAEQRTRPVTQDEKDRLGVLIETFNDISKRKSSDPIGLAERAKIVRSPVAIDPNVAPDGMFSATLAARNAQAAAAQNFYGGEYKVLKPEEADALKVRFAAAGEAEQLQILRAAGQGLDERGLRAFVDQIGGKEQLNFVATTARDRPDLAQEIMHGKTLLDQKDVQEKGKLIRPLLAQKLGGQVWPADMQETVVSAAMYVDTARRATRGALYDETDTSGFEQALDDVAGKLIKRNGARVPVPRGMTQARFEGVLDNLTDKDVAAFGGAYDRNGVAFDAKFLGSRAVLKPLEIGGSRYVVGLPDRSARDGFQPVWTASETPEPLVIDMRLLAAGPTRAPVPRAADPYGLHARSLKAARDAGAARPALQIDEPQP